jgi:hypothetical protein
MTQRSPAVVFILCFVTLGIYGIVWYVKTKGEMKAKGADIPTAWLMIVPIVNFFWLWKWSQGVEKVTGGSSSAGLTFVLMILLGPIGAAITQGAFNKVSAGAGAPKPPRAEEKPEPPAGE